MIGGGDGIFFVRQFIRAILGNSSFVCVCECVRLFYSNLVSTMAVGFHVGYNVLISSLCLVYFGVCVTANNSGLITLSRRRTSKRWRRVE